MNEYVRVSSKRKWHWHTDCHHYNKTLEKEHDIADEADPRTESNRCDRCMELQEKGRNFLV